MAATKTPPCRYETAGDLLARLGGIEPERVKLNPPAGRATKRDLVHYRGPGQYELVDRVIVAKAACPLRDYLAFQLAFHLGNYVEQQEVGFLCGPGAWAEVLPGVIRNPDVSYFSWELFPDRCIPMVQISAEAPDLAVEILSQSNTRKEMRIKLKEYFLGGVKLVWIIDPRTRTAEAYTAPDVKTAIAPDVKTAIAADGSLEGGDVLPGFRLPLAQLFEKFPAPTAKKPTKRKKK